MNPVTSTLSNAAPTPPAPISNAALQRLIDAIFGFGSGKVQRPLLHAALGAFQALIDGLGAGQLSDYLQSSGIVTKLPDPMPGSAIGALPISVEQLQKIVDGFFTFAEANVKRPLVHVGLSVLQALLDSVGIPILYAYLQANGIISK